MKIVYNENAFKKAIKEAREGEDILLYDNEIRDKADYMAFQRYVSKLIMFNRKENFKLYAGLIFKKQNKNTSVGVKAE